MKHLNIFKPKAMRIISIFTFLFLYISITNAQIYFGEGVPIDIDFNDQARLIDLDNDGDLDLIDAERFRENIGSPSNFEFGPWQYNVFGLPLDTSNPFDDVEVEYYLSFVDFDFDGDQDVLLNIIACCQYLHGSGDSYFGSSELRMYENTGTASVPFFTEIDPVDWDSNWIFTRELADFDLDGEYELVGNTLIDYCYSTTSNMYLEAFYQDVGPSIHNTTSIMEVKIVDFDGDDDLDIVLHSYNFQMLENTGTPSSPEFDYENDADLPVNPFGIESGLMGLSVVGDLDGDLDMDFIGHSGGVFKFYENQLQYNTDVCDVADTNDGEAGWGIWEDGGADAALTNNQAFASSGTYSFLIKDNTTTSVITSNSFDLNTEDKVDIHFSFIADGFDNSNEDFWLQVSTDNGISFETVEEWNLNDEFINGERVFDKVTIIGPFTNETKFRFRCDASGNNDKIYIDDISILTCEATCHDGILNGIETDIDCGGNCLACPTCYDGIMNGNEVDIDCGGDCIVCPTCDDGIMNGDEEGVDCGGSNCMLCPSCDDGIQNQDEEGIDCGGSICMACPTCDDGIMNGDEEGIDCGGSNCMLCSSCDDGIQNGNETGIDCGGSDCPECNECMVNYTLTLQSEIDNFISDYPNCLYINGALTIDGAGISDLSGLNHIIGISGSLKILNTSISDLAGFESLQSIGSKIEIIGNDLLVNISGFNNLTTTNTILNISNNTLLNDIDGFQELIELKSLIILNSYSLQTLDALHNLNTIHQNLILRNCDQLTQVISPNPSYIDDLEISKCDAFLSLSIGNNAEIHDIEISDNDLLLDIPGFNNLINSNYILIENNSELEVINGFNNLTETALYIKNNDNLFEISGFNESVFDPFELRDNGSLSLITGLLLGVFSDKITIIDCVSLEDLNFFDTGIIDEGAEVRIEFNDLLSVCSAGAICDVINNGKSFQSVKENAAGCSSNEEIIESCLNENCLLSNYDSFEADWGSWESGGSNSVRIQQNQNSGIYSIRLRSNSETASMTSSTLDLSEYSFAEINFSFISHSLDNTDDDFWLQVSYDDGATYTTTNSWVYINDFDNSTRQYDNVLLEGPFSESMKFRFRADFTALGDHLHLDDIFIVLCSEPIEICSELDFNNAETGWDIWNDGGADAARANNSNFSNSGTYSFLIKDNTSTSVITTDALDLSSYDSLAIDFNFIAVGFNNNSQEFWLQVSTDNGATFATVWEWTYASDFENGIREFENIPIVGAFSNETMIRFRCDATGNNDKVYLDDILITGCTDDGLIEPIQSESRKSHEPTVRIYPNPISQNKTLTVELDKHHDFKRFMLYDLSGRQVKKKDLNSAQQTIIVEMDQLNAGTYILKLTGSTDVFVEKVMVVE